MRVERVLLTGSSGFIGTALLRSLTQNRISTITLHRRPSAQRTGASELWDPYAPTPVSRPERLEGITAAVHLSGANLAGRRWTSAYKREISASRVVPTHALAKLLAGLQSKPDALVLSAPIVLHG